MLTIIRPALLEGFMTTNTGLNSLPIGPDHQDQIQLAGITVAHELIVNWHSSSPQDMKTLSRNWGNLDSLNIH
jgi:hypothetical protein